MFVLPINRDERPTRTPYILITLIVINTAVFLLGYLLGPQQVFFQQYGFTPADPHVFNAFSSLFVHSGVWHLLGNMWFLWMFGKQVEDVFGRWIFAATYLCCGMGAHALHYAFNMQSSIPCVGASGAISGVAGIYFILFPKSRFDLTFYLGWLRVGSISTFTHAAVGTWIGEQILLGIISQTTHSFGIAFWAHVGGFVVGLAAGLACILVVPEREHTRVPVNAPEDYPGAPDLGDAGMTQLKLTESSHELHK